MEINIHWENLTIKLAEAYGFCWGVELDVQICFLVLTRLVLILCYESDYYYFYLNKYPDIVNVFFSNCFFFFNYMRIDLM